MTAYLNGSQVRWGQIRSRILEAFDAQSPGGTTGLYVSTYAQDFINGRRVGATYAEEAQPTINLIQDALTILEGANGTFWVVAGAGRSNFPTAPGRIRGSAGGVGYAFYLTEIVGSTRVEVDSIQGDLNGGEPQPSVVRDDIVVRELTGWSQGFVEVRPSDSLLEGIPARAREFAYRTAVAERDTHRGVFWVAENGRFEHRVLASGVASYPTGESMVRGALASYREALRSRMGRPLEQALREEEQRRAEHRQATAANFRRFAQREATEAVLVPTLPFVPNGLASSRRWGIEVESGGARGVQAPEDWEAVSDGSLRSAYDGYVEVQDFEPYDEEVTERVSWRACTNGERHLPYIERYDSEQQEYVFDPRPDFIPVADCQACGEVTRMVHREPQTIRHTARSGDCREFVSPILVSMHSKGLKQLTEALSKNPQNDSSGVHVHVEADDLTPKQIQTLVFGYDILEPLLESSYKRNRRDFCNRRDVDAVLSHARDAREGRELRVDDRYLTVNLQSLQRHGTIEFRAMGPVYEYDHLIRWAMLCRELVNVVANGATMKDFSKVTNWSALLNLLARFGKEYVRAAVYELTGETGEAAKLEKQGRPVTSEALAADLSAAWERITDRFREFGQSVGEAAGRLVGVGSAGEI